MAHAKKGHHAKRKLTGAAKEARDFAAGKGYSVRHTEPSPGKHTVTIKHGGKTTTKRNLSKAAADDAFVNAVVNAKG